jgi:outer membrane protein OmpA-like peptidoglycan-associated protein
MSTEYQFLIMKPAYIFTVIALFLMPAWLWSQKLSPITLTNPSFEDLPQCCETPTGWFNCGSSASETPPDVQPGSFEVSKPASNGETYVGMVARDNDSWEAISQRLSTPLQRGLCYDFSLDLCRSELYISANRTTSEKSNYVKPIKLRIYGGNGYCAKGELLAETALISNYSWLQYNFRLSPKSGNYAYILLEAFYETPTLFPYNGHLLLDNASALQPYQCNEPPPKKPVKEAIAANVPKKPTPPTKKPTRSTSGTTLPVEYSTPSTATAATKPINQLERSRIKKGETIRLEKIFFDADKTAVKQESEPALTEIYDFLFKNQDVFVEIGGHTNGIPADEFCDQLSTQRAKSVTDWLVAKGIASERVKYKGYGKRFKKYSDATLDGRTKNQRVEIKILQMNG